AQGRAGAASAHSAGAASRAVPCSGAEPGDRPSIAMAAAVPASERRGVTMTGIGHNRWARHGLAIGILCGLAGCQHLGPWGRQGKAPSGTAPGTIAGLGRNESDDQGGTPTPFQEADLQFAFARAAERRGDLDLAMAGYKDAL